MDIVLKYIKDMFQNMIIVSPIIILSRFLLLRYIKSKNMKTTILHEIGIIVFILFLVGLASQTITINSNISSKNSDINLELFKVFYRTYYSLFVSGYYEYFLINFLGNILIFIPIGFFIPLLWEKKYSLLMSVISGFFISLFIEVSQLALPRTTDVDDLWLNTLGAFLGYILFYIMSKKFPHIVYKFRITSNKSRP